MAHNLAFKTDGGRAFYSLREPAWHGLGTVVDRPLSDPAIVQVAGLDWQATKKGLYTADLSLVDSHCAIVRSDTGSILSVVSRDYEPVQNTELFAWLRDVAGVNEMTIETAGALGDGGRVWAMARIPGLDCVIGKDASIPYLLVTNGHTGRHTLRLIPTSVRVVCANTLRMATSGKSGSTLSSGWEVRHRSGIKQAMADIAQAYQSALREWECTANAQLAMSDVRATAETMTRIAAAAFPAIAPGADESDRAKAMRSEREGRLAAIRASATCNVEGTAGTVYSDLQAVTEYLDHEGGRSDASRFESALFGGDRDAQKAAAWEAALALV